MDGVDDAYADSRKTIETDIVAPLTQVAAIGRFRKKFMVQKRFIANLESARGLAALMVCLFHAGAIRIGAGPAVVDRSSLLGIILNGHGAVIFFFVLSGYVLRLSLAGKSALPPGIISIGFFNARLFRLFPVIIATVAVSACSFWIFRGTPIDPAHILKNMFLIDASIVGPFWTLQAEVLGSVLVLLVFLLERRWGFAPVVAITLLLLPLSFVGSRAAITSYLHLGHLYPFVVGYALAARPLSSARSKRLSAILLFCALSAFFGAHVYGNPFAQWALLVTVLSSVVIILVLADGQTGTVLAWRPLRALGALSFSFYALHPLGLWIAQGLSLHFDLSEVPNSVITTVTFAAAVASTVAMAVVMRYVVERPGIAAGKWVFARLLRPPAKDHVLRQGEPQLDARMNG